MDSMGEKMEDQPCAWCERGWALIGVVMGTVIILLSIDLATNGMLAGLISKPIAARESEDE